mmetsp:Transcript_12693/g.19012  ORF Transcript_12693/g.19012 Transcript_12693/m.19012 type:complete len:218 (-) Transcript_12693:553-1206(-)
MSTNLAVIQLQREITQEEDLSIDLSTKWANLKGGQDIMPTNHYRSDRVLTIHKNLSTPLLGDHLPDLTTKRIILGWQEEKSIAPHISNTRNDFIGQPAIGCLRTINHLLYHPEESTIHTIIIGHHYLTIPVVRRHRIITTEETHMVTVVIIIPTSNIIGHLQATKTSGHLQATKNASRSLIIPAAKLFCGASVHGKIILNWKSFLSLTEVNILDILQ